MTALSQRAQSLGTENAFVVLAEVNKLIREGRNIISFCIGQPDFATPQHIQDAGIAAIEHAVLFLQTSPFSCRKAAQNPFLRELVIPFGATGYVALFEITNAHQVTVAAVRHQRESDYH